MRYTSRPATPKKSTVSRTNILYRLLFRTAPQRPDRGRAGVWFVVAALTLWLLSWAGARSLIIASPLASADAILVMSGAPVYEERLRHAASVYAAGRGQWVIISNDGVLWHWSRAVQRNLSSVDIAIATLGASGVPRERILVLPGVVESTRDEALAAVSFAESHGISTMNVVTSPYHTRRTMWALGLATRGHRIVVGSDPVPLLESPSPATWWVHGSGWPMVALEFVKLPYYWVRFGLLGNS